MSAYGVRVLGPDAKALNDAMLGSLDERIDVPRYRRGELRRSIVHVGVGGFHRSHLATYVDELCRHGTREWSIVGAGVLPGDSAMAEALAPQDHLYTLLIRSAEGAEASIVGSIVDYLHAHPDPTALVERIAHPDTQIVSMTVTEGGYPIDDESGEYSAASPVAGPGSAFGTLVRGLQLRRSRGLGPVTVMSCDNIMANGDAARASTLGEAAQLDDALSSWIADSVAFPSSMVDRITPVTTDEDRAWLETELGVVDRWPVVAEPFRQWVLEDRFAAERPPLDEVGVLLTDDVEPYELLKLRLLNASHSGLAYLSALLDVELVDEAMAIPEIARFVGSFLDEAATALDPVPGIEIGAYKRSLVERYSNPGVGDQIARLCLDGSAKFPKFLIPTIRQLLAARHPVEMSALALAGWCQYLVGTSESGAAITHSADPQLDLAIAHARASMSDPRAFLGFSDVFGRDLAGDRVFVDAFVDSVTALRAHGVQATIDRAIGKGADGR